MFHSVYDRLFLFPSFALMLLVTINPLRADDDPPKKVEASLVILTPLEIASVAMIGEKSPVREEFITWIKPVFGALEPQFAQEKAKRTIVVQVTLHPDRAAELAIAGRPEPSKDEIDALEKLIDIEKAPRSRFVDCAFRIVAKINGGDPDEDKPLSPTLRTPFEQRMAEFRKTPSSKQFELMKHWARFEAIPLIGQTAADADPKFAGVRNLGKALQELQPEGPIDIAALTDKNPDYWRAMMEMVPGNLLVPTTQMVLFAANGQFDSASRIAHTFASFDRHQSGYSALTEDFMAMADVFAQGIHARIGKGIKLNDAGKLDEALKVYDDVLKDYPHSAWAHFERYQTAMAQAMRAKQGLPEWAPTRKAILESDALYPSMAQASSGDELYDLLLRKESEELFKDKSKTVKDLLRYADIALDLDQPGFAAMIYWNVLTNTKPEMHDKRELTEDVLYCLEQLGTTELKTNFKGDHAAAFARIDTERAQRKKESPAGRVMARPGEPKKKSQ